MRCTATFFGDLAFLAGARFVILEQSEEFLGCLDLLGLSIDSYVPFCLW